jgi:hypothetical protein
MLRADLFVIFGPALSGDKISNELDSQEKESDGNDHHNKMFGYVYGLNVRHSSLKKAQGHEGAEPAENSAHADSHDTVDDFRDSSGPRI